jgi:hypothetical protein
MNELLQSILGLSESEATIMLASNPTPDYLVGLLGFEHIDVVMKYSSQPAAAATLSEPKEKPKAGKTKSKKYKPFKVDPKELSSLVCFYLLIFRWIVVS